jgi:glucose/arabinose dehydrogenase
MTRSLFPSFWVQESALLRRLLLLWGVVLLCLPSPIHAQDLGASVRVPVQVPGNLRSGPFAGQRYLTVPPGFAVSVYARVSGARFLAVAPNGDLLVSQPGAGRITILQQNADGTSRAATFASGLRNPHGMVFHTISDTTYLYVSESHQIDRYVYNWGDTQAHDRQVVVSGLPDNSSPELRGAYAHALKNIALGPDDKLYVSIGSSCNVCLSDTQSDPVRGAIYQYDADGSNGRLFARGLRNAEGLAFVPGSNDLWVVVNNRDNLAYPYRDYTGNYGRVLASYVDDHPPEEFLRVRDGGNYGWPFCNPNPDTENGYDSMPFDLDVEMNRDGAVDCSAMDTVTKGIQAHSAPLGLLFLQNTAFAAPYGNGAVVALHGSWNRTQRTGYKVVYFPWDADNGVPGAQVDLITGWLDDATQNVWGRPVGLAVGPDGSLYVSDDEPGTVYRVTYTPLES